MLVVFFSDAAPTEIYTLSLHDALPISDKALLVSIYMALGIWGAIPRWIVILVVSRPDRKSTRLNSSHGYISYAVFCLKKKLEESLVIVKADVARRDFELALDFAARKFD